MRKNIQKFIAVGLCTMSILAITTATTKVANATEINIAQKQGEVLQDLRVPISRVYYSDMIAGDGKINFTVKLPEGVKLIKTTTPKIFSEALTQNYDISISEGVHYNKEQFSINVNWANKGIEFVGDWILNIDGSVFTDGRARKIVIDVVNDLAQVGAPKITTNVENGVTARQLTEGFDLEMNIENAKFNTSCFGNYIRVSMINSSGLRIHPVAYCDSLKPNRVKMRVQATNGVESWRTHFEFRIEGNASNSQTPITVRIPIIK